MVLLIQSCPWNPSPPLKAPLKAVGKSAQMSSQFRVSLCLPRTSTMSKLSWSWGSSAPAPKIISILSLQAFPAQTLPAPVSLLGVEPSDFWHHQSLFFTILSILLLSPQNVCSSAFVYWMVCWWRTRDMDVCNLRVWNVWEPKRGFDELNWRTRPFSIGENLHCCIIVKISIPSLNKHL